ncbi:MAG: Uma2 family endonuclease, partial [Bryobacterales bacterium]|nr:Uma2 family endonuclease [Bryobacterales bacterium]
FKVWEEGKPPDFVLEVASPSTAENDARHKAQEYLGIGVREYWRLDPEGTMMGTPLEGYRARGGRYQRVESVAGTGGVEYLRSGVLGLDLRGEQRSGATVLVIRDPRTGEEIDGALEASEQQRRIAEARASSAKKELGAVRDELGAVKDELGTAKDRASTAEERVRVLEQQLREVTDQTRLMGRDS